MRAAIIEGGIYGLEGEQRRESRYALWRRGSERQKAGDREVVFLPRHGRGHASSPQNQFRTIWALKELAVTIFCH